MNVHKYAACSCCSCSIPSLSLQNDSCTKSGLTDRARRPLTSQPLDRAVKRSGPSNTGRFGSRTRLDIERSIASLRGPQFSARSFASACVSQGARRCWPHLAPESWPHPHQGGVALGPGLSRRHARERVRPAMAGDLDHERERDRTGAAHAGGLAEAPWTGAAASLPRSLRVPWPNRDPHVPGPRFPHWWVHALACSPRLCAGRACSQTTRAVCSHVAGAAHRRFLTVAARTSGCLTRPVHRHIPGRGSDAGPPLPPPAGARTCFLRAASRERK
jgi:hypothetical protein